MESLHSAIPESISPKVAERLGIAPANLRSWESQHSQASQSSEMKRRVPSVEGMHTIPPAISVKAADRLAFSQSPSQGTAQSPGLILWPSTFIPVEPLALEMHACKHMHVLLGCKAALSDFIQDIKGADDKAHISQEELNDLTWEYECFRRKRFNWPAELPLSITPNINTNIPKSTPARPDSSSGHPTSSSADTIFFRRTNGFVRPKTGHAHQRNALTSSEPSVSTYDCGKLTFVRVFRIYEAIKVAKPQDK